MAKARLGIFSPPTHTWGALGASLESLPTGVVLAPPTCHEKGNLNLGVQSLGSKSNTFLSSSQGSTRTNRPLEAWRDAQSLRPVCRLDPRSIPSFLSLDSIFTASAPSTGGQKQTLVSSKSPTIIYTGFFFRTAFLQVPLPAEMRDRSGTQ